MATSAREIEPRPHWSKDYVEHLRTVHFTLVVVCLALVVLATSNRKGKVSNAREELRGIRSLVEKWDPNWIKKEKERTLAGLNFPSEQLAAAGRDELEVDLPNGKSEVIELQYDGPNWMMNAPDDTLSSTIVTPYPGRLDLAPDTLGEFHEFWDTLAKHLRFEVPVELADTPLAFHLTQPLKARFVSGKKATISGPLHLKLSIPLKNSPIYNDYPKAFYGADPTARSPASSTPFPVGEFIVVPVRRYKFEYLNLHPRFAGPNFEWQREPFSDAFPNLSSLTKNYEELDFGAVDNTLQAEESREGDSFEAIGIKFPAANLTRWGILLILGIQLYFLLHLHELTPKLKPTDEGFQVAWIGIYKSALSRMLYFASTVLLPACATFALAYRMPTLTNHDWWLRLGAVIMGTALSLLLGSLAWKTLRKTSL